jgi:glycosyl hydrolase family 64 (putative beta-1,3-glucanase)
MMSSFEEGALAMNKPAIWILFSIVLVASACGSGSVGGTGTAGVGVAGSTGTAGATGSAGGTGSSGATGSAGSTGTAGATGSAGSSGSSGATGSAGSTGTAGAGGMSGAAGVGSAAGAGGTYTTNPDRVPCGTKAGQCECQPTLAERRAPAFPPTQITAPKGLLFRFMNNCPMTLWLQFAGSPNGAPVMLPTRTTQEFDMQTLHGRVTAFKNAAPGGAGSVEAEFFELTADPGKALNYNLSFVDYMGLPLEINGKGPPASCGLTACYAPLADLVKGCPTQLLDTVNNKCNSMFSYCNNAAHAQEAFCTSLDQSAAMTLANDPMCKAGGTLAQAGSGAKILGCATGSFWSGSPYCCAKVNRNATNGTGSDNTQNCTYYKTAPYNVYAAYSHSVCPYIYAFAYDDWNDQSGYHACTGGTGADITYCPGDP